MKVKYYLVTIDIEKASDSLEHTFLIRALSKKLWIRKNFYRMDKSIFE